MKLTITRTLVLSAIVLFLYASCKKSGLAPLSSAKNLKTDSIAGQIAAGLVQSLNAKYGGSNINDGIKAPSIYTSAFKGPIVYGLDPLCGFTIDSTYRTRNSAEDQVKYDQDVIDWGHFKFTYTCSTDRLDGYAVHDTVNHQQSGTSFKKLYTINQDYIVKALDNTYKLVFMKGSSGSSVYVSSLTTVHKLVSKYIYESVTVNFSTGTADMQGTVSFTTAYTDPVPQLSINYKGTIKFLGGNTFAQLNIDNPDGTPGGKSYKVNMITGETTLIGNY